MKFIVLKLPKMSVLETEKYNENDDENNERIAEEEESLGTPETEKYNENDDENNEGIAEEEEALGTKRNQFF